MDLEMPIACRLGDAEQARRTAEVEALIVEGAELVEELADGYALRFPGDSIWLTRLAELVAAERVCCPFLTFAIEAKPGEGPLWLRIQGSAAAKRFVAAQFLPAPAE